jgi:tetratricopeptide (TPR) repeat protein
MGNALNDKGELDAAIDSYKQALKINPDYAEAYNNMAYALKKQAKMEEAIEAYNKALTIKPDVAEVYNNMGLALVDYGQMEEAIEAFNKALSLNPDHAESYNNMGNALTRQDKLEEAIEAFSKALSLKSDFAEAYSNMGNTLVDQGKLEGAIKAYRKAIAIKPNLAEVYNNMSLALLATQNFSQGFKLHEWRWKTKERDGTFLQSSKPLWNNEQGKSVFVWGEQGIGDEIMFAAMIPELHKLSSKIILRCDARLIPLFKRSFPGNIIYYSKGEAVAEDEYDFHIPIGSLANIFRTSLESFKQTSAGFLNYDREKTSRLRGTILAGEEKKVIGISWKTQTELKGGGKRNIKLADLVQRLDHADTRLVCLQYGDVDDELKALKSDLGIEIMQVPEVDNMNDIDGLASLIMACDQVVSTTNVTVHLAGALGANTKVLLPSSTRWFWGSSGSDSFWYDTVSPCRQNNTGDWSDVLRALA